MLFSSVFAVLGNGAAMVTNKTGKMMQFLYKLGI
jgi:hypothetical protein